MSAAYPSAAAAVGAAVRKNGHLIAGATALTPFDEMAAREAGDHSEEEQAIRSEAVEQWVGWCWQGEMDLERAFRRFLSMTRLWKPELVAGINIRQAAAIFGQTPAAQSVVERELVATAYAKAGYRSAHVPGQKGADARANMAKAQRGNKHRARSVKNKKQSA